LSSARQRRGKLGLLTVAADDRHVGGQVHAHTQPHALLAAHRDGRLAESLAYVEG